MNTLNELSQAEKKQRVLVLCNENEIAGLQAQGLPVSCEDSLLSMQHLKMARLEAERRHKLHEGLQVFTITPEPVQATEAERALIYAMLVRCRKVISCRDKLEDMLKFLIPNYIAEGKNQLVISIGCTGGKHRSVTLANALYERLSGQKGYGLKIEHRDIGKDALRGK